MNNTASFSFDNSYARLPERFFVRMPPTPVAGPRLVRLNYGLAQRLGLDPESLSSAEGLEVLSGNQVPEGSHPLAMAYAGHQFGGWVPQLGDGRAILLGELIDKDGVRLDILLKGAGRTPFSRGGDGRAVLGPVLREYIVSEAMAALGVPTTRALAAVTTGEVVMREGPMPGAILTRIAQSHVRVGTFEFFASRGDVDALRLLADYVIARHYPEAIEAENPYRVLLDNVAERQAELIARWQLIGFIHGVMNTDNMSIAGETIDYGPCAFIDTYHPETVYSSIDHAGRYAYCNQPQIAKWNLTCLAQSLLPLLGEDDDAAIQEATGAIDAFPDKFDTAYLAGIRSNQGLTKKRGGDMALAQDLFRRMEENKADFTLTFRGLGNLSAAGPEADSPVRELFSNPTAFDDWAIAWRRRLADERTADAERQAAMCAINPAFIPRNHLVEEAINAAVQSDDLALFQDLVSVLSSPYEDQPENSRHTLPPRNDQIVQATFCGT
jgi:uncharacterized protein YdiU (UPF0061 family)